MGPSARPAPREPRTEPTVRRGCEVMCPFTKGREQVKAQDTHSVQQPTDSTMSAISKTTIGLPSLHTSIENASGQIKGKTANDEDVTSSRVFHRKLSHKPIFIERAMGNYLYEQETGRRILDGCGGAAVVSVGHCVPQIVEAVAQQIGQLPYLNSATFAHQVGRALIRKPL